MEDTQKYIQIRFFYIADAPIKHILSYYKTTVQWRSEKSMYTLTGGKSLSLVFRETKVPDIRRKMTELQTQVEIAKARSHVRYWHVSSG